MSHLGIDFATFRSRVTAVFARGLDKGRLDDLSNNLTAMVKDIFKHNESTLLGSFYVRNKTSLEAIIFQKKLTF